MIEKREENSSPITAHGIHESISSISLETIDLYLKQLEAQKLQAQADISNSFRQLTSLLLAREKQLLRQVDAIHDHLILILQSRKTFSPDTATCCEDKEDFELQEQETGTLNNKSSSVKASPGIEVSLNSKELEDHILTIGKVEMTGTSFMHLSEDNETFIFPCRVQNYQETSQDHMLLYKPLDAAESHGIRRAKREGIAMESREVETISRRDSTDTLICKENSNVTNCHLRDVGEEIDGGGPHVLGKEKENNNEKKDERLLRELSDERSEDVQHWMREILNETNSEPTSCDPERFDLFTVLKCNRNKEDIKHDKLIVRTEPLCPSNVSESDVVLEKNAGCCKKSSHDLTPEECPAVSGVLSECDLIE